MPTPCPSSEGRETQVCEYYDCIRAVVATMLLLHAAESAHSGFSLRGQCGACKLDYQFIIQSKKFIVISVATCG